MQFPSISLIIPCYNESTRIGLLFDGIKDFSKMWMGDYEIIIVDDGSSDGTDIVIQSHPDYFNLLEKKRITFLHQENKGKGGALKLGVAHATKEFILTLDADMATSPIEIAYWLEMRRSFSKKEILIASRELKNSKVQDSLKRKFIGNVFNFIIRKAVGLQINDTQCGFKLYPREIAQKLFSSLKTLGWAHDVELLSRANKLGYAIVEMPITWNAVEGSKIKVLHDSWNMFWEVMKISRLKKKWNQT